MPENEETVAEETQEESSEETTETETETEDTSTETETETEEESDEEKIDLVLAKQGLQLLEALQNPRTSMTVLKALAESQGFTISQPNREEQDTDIGVKSLLKKSLGADWEFLADKLSPVLEQIERRVESKFEERDISSRQQSMKSAENGFFKENPEAKRHFKEMRSLAQDYPPPANKDYSQYFTNLYHMASAGKGSISDTVQRKRNNRTKNNQKEVDVETQNRSKPNVTKSGKPPSLAEAIRQAAASLKNQGV